MTENTATQAQITYIKRLTDERVLDDFATEMVVRGRQFWTDREFTSKRASALIDVLSAMPRKQVREERAEAPEGMHVLKGDSKYGVDVIFKVQRAVHGSGHVYAKRLVLHDQGCGICGGDHACNHTANADRYTVTFEMEPGAVYCLSQDTLMDLEDAKRWGALYGTCCVCGRTLTDEESISNGIGPVCAAKFGA